MGIQDNITARRAVLGGVGSLVTAGGVCALTRRCSGAIDGGASGANASDGGGATPAESADVPPMHSSTETTGLGVDLSGNPLTGSMDAPVDIYYYSDFQCPFCEQFEHGALPKLLDNEVADGTARLVFLEFPYIGNRSTTAAVAAKCVWRQVHASSPRTYWRWHSAVFDAQGKPNSGWATRANLLDITASVDGVDADTVGTCMDEHRSAIESSLEATVAQATEFGVEGTPTFVLYDREGGSAARLVGAQPYERFAEAITTVRDG
ncbi:DsbA family protein [Halorarius halobius]|uniref:DsbA family protein n=1 Tax=Halorarius halobius TaxID=2962671 RepID=UPI0020CD77E2|nr:thioredoxin domain-containing protein [Halorarius halobius]